MCVKSHCGLAKEPQLEADCEVQFGVDHIPERRVSWVGQPGNA